MRCEQARQLFDAYLDGELSPALATELGAHRVQCPECRRALALLEVSGHIIASDREPVRVGRDFSDRLLACMEFRPGRWTLRMRRIVYIGGPLAAAAVVALAFVGVFDPDKGQRASYRERPSEEMISEWLREEDNPSPGDDQAARILDEWGQHARENVDAKRQSGESLQQMLDLTVIQLLDTLNEANEASAGDGQLPALDIPAPSPPTEATPPEVEDGGNR